MILVVLMTVLFLRFVLAEGRRGRGLISSPAIVIPTPYLLLRARLVDQRCSSGVEITAVSLAVLHCHLVRLRVGGFRGVFWRVEAGLFFVSLLMLL